jgi:hypothetical protein
MTFSRCNFLGLFSAPARVKNFQRPRYATEAPMRFREIGVQAGLTTARNFSSERRYLVETMGGGGIALFDCLALCAAMSETL